MLSVIFVYSIFAISMVRTLIRPSIGVIAMYGFICLDPKWNWRWSIDTSFRYQIWIFTALISSFFLSGMQVKELSRRSKFGFCSIIFLFAWFFLASTQSVDPVRSEWFMNYFNKLLVLNIFCLLLTNTKRLLLTLIAVVVAGTWYNAYQLNLDYFQNGGFTRYAFDSVWGSKGYDNNTQTLLSLPALSFAISYSLYANGLKKIVAVGVSLTLAHLIMLFNSRGGMIGGLATLLFIAVFLPRVNRAKLQFTLVLLAGSFLAGPSVVEEFSSSFKSQEERDYSANSRLLLWEASWEMSKDFPLFGVGPDAGRSLMGKYYTGPDGDGKALHNIFFDISTGGGFPALFFYLCFVTGSWLYVYKTYDRTNRSDPLNFVRLSLVGGIPGYLTASIFSSALLQEQGFLLPTLGYCLANIDYQQQKQAQNYDVQSTQISPS